jgi:hypothetical protein
MTAHRVGTIDHRRGNPFFLSSVGYGFLISVSAAAICCSNFLVFSRKRRAVNWTILSDISLDTHGVDVVVMPRIAVVLEVLIMAMMLSLSLMDVSGRAYRPASDPKAVSPIGRERTPRGHGLRVIELKNI